MNLFKLGRGSSSPSFPLGYASECAPVTSISKTIVIADVGLSFMETITDLSDQWIQNILNKKETEEGKSKKGAFWLF